MYAYPILECCNGYVAITAFNYWVNMYIRIISYMRYILITYVYLVLEWSNSGH